MKTISIDTLVKNNAAHVWEAYTDPKHIVHWNFASHDWHCPHAENELVVGGTYSARMEAKDGSFGFDFKAVHDEIIPEKKISYTMEDGRKVTTLFENTGQAVKITTVFEPEHQNPLD